MIFNINRQTLSHSIVAIFWPFSYPWVMGQWEVSKLCSSLFILMLPPNQKKGPKLGSTTYFYVKFKDRWITIKKLRVKSCYINYLTLKRIFYSKVTNKTNRPACPWSKFNCFAKFSKNKIALEVSTCWASCTCCSPRSARSINGF